MKKCSSINSRRKEGSPTNPLAAKIQVHINIPLFKISENHILPHYGNKSANAPC
jgi:hypothetical protein